MGSTFLGISKINIEPQVAVLPVNVDMRKSQLVARHQQRMLRTSQQQKLKYIQQMSKSQQSDLIKVQVQNNSNQDILFSDGSYEENGKFCPSPLQQPKLNVQMQKEFVFRTDVNT